MGALKTINELYSRLGEEYLILLPETIPFLAECMEGVCMQTLLAGSAPPLGIIASSS